LINNFFIFKAVIIYNLFIFKTVLIKNFFIIKCFLPEFAKPRFATLVKYGKTELVPPTPAEIPAAIGQASRLVQSAVTFRWTKLTVKVSHFAGQGDQIGRLLPLRSFFQIYKSSPTQRYALF
jgi:hypothetical protein